ncbi:copper chaperone PCu(A)C [Mesorhizobium sp. Z1-4]|uniref:copper chaperone PCu(A)C n=1 Tax=Mesorhizobium sp. Z1-4 TaxID=2448478 RepID=UPI000FDC68AD|nr:copper chaperone PCu(A)C [Mesorhizobium sp. Z1-4]
MIRLLPTMVLGLLVPMAGGHATEGPPTHGAGPDELSVEHAEIVLPTSGKSQLTGYLTIWNGKRVQANLVSVESPIFESVALYNMEQDGGIARKRRVEGILPIPGNAELLMRPGGVHLLLTQPIQALSSEEAVELTLVFDSGKRIAVTATILAAGTSVTDHHHGNGDGVQGSGQL